MSRPRPAKLAGYVVLLALLSVVKAQPVDPYLANWMGRMQPIIGTQTILDLTLPGTHDTETYDLGLTISPGAIDGEPTLSYILHVFSKFAPDKWIRELAYTQALNITAQLNAGVRFLDFRTMMNGTAGDWYSLHFMETKQMSLVYLTRVRDWLLAHPTEVVVFKVSKHGSDCNAGKRAFAGVSAADKYAFWLQIKSLFKGLMFDTSQYSLNTTSIDTLVATNQRVILIMEDWAEFTKNDTLALDACSTFYHPPRRHHYSQISHPPAESTSDTPPYTMKDVYARYARLRERHLLPALHYRHHRQAHKDSNNSDAYFTRRVHYQVAMFAAAKTDRALAKRANQFYAVWMAGAVPGAQRLDSFLIHKLPWLFKKENIEHCAASFQVEGLTSWCPMGLLDCCQLTNYYQQWSYEAAIEKGYDMPVAICADALDYQGTVRTGAWPLYNSTAFDLPINASSPNAETKYSYSYTLLYSSVRRLCASQNTTVCSSTLQFLRQQRARFPFKAWNSAVSGRLPHLP